MLFSQNTGRFVANIQHGFCADHFSRHALRGLVAEEKPSPGPVLLLQEKRAKKPDHVPELLDIKLVKFFVRISEKQLKWL